MRDVLCKLKEGKSVEVPIYDFTTHQRVKDTKRVYGATVIVFEGIMSFFDEYLRDIMDVKGSAFPSVSNSLKIGWLKYSGGYSVYSCIYVV